MRPRLDDFSRLDFSETGRSLQEYEQLGTGSMAALPVHRRSLPTIARSSLDVPAW